MTKFYINYGENFDLWYNQNNAEAIDCFEGCLLDSMVLSCKRGYAFCYEHYVNPWASNYLVVFVPYKDEAACRSAWEDWEAAREKAEA